MPSLEYKEDTRLYLTRYYSLRSRHKHPVRSWTNLFIKLIYDMAKTDPTLDLKTITKDTFYSRNLPCISVKRSIEAGMLPRVFEWEMSSLWQRILTRTENSNEYNPPVPTKLEIGIYPNPFNPSTTVTFSLPLTSNVKLCVFNLRGQKVKDLINGEVPRGFHKIVWDGKDSNGSSIGSGIYFIRLESGGNSYVRKVMMVK